MKTQIAIGDSTRGYSIADVTKTASGKYRIVKGTEHGYKTMLKKAIANVNRGQMSVVTSAGDELPVTIRR